MLDVKITIEMKMLNMKLQDIIQQNMNLTHCTACKKTVSMNSEEFYYEIYRLANLRVN